MSHDEPSRGVQYLSDAEGKTVGVFVPIAVWREIESERETVDLLKSPMMKQRLLEAKGRRGGPPIEGARAQPGIRSLRDGGLERNAQIS
jgi:hypothetical protein